MAAHAHLTGDPSQPRARQLSLKPQGANHASASYRAHARKHPTVCEGRQRPAAGCAAAVAAAPAGVLCAGRNGSSGCVNDCLCRGGRAAAAAGAVTVGDACSADHTVRAGTHYYAPWVAAAAANGAATPHGWRSRCAAKPCPPHQLQGAAALLSSWGGWAGTGSNISVCAFSAATKLKHADRQVGAEARLGPQADQAGWRKRVSAGVGRLRVQTLIKNSCCSVPRSHTRPALAVPCSRCGTSCASSRSATAASRTAVTCTGRRDQQAVRPAA